MSFSDSDILQKNTVKLHDGKTFTVGVAYPFQRKENGLYIVVLTDKMEWVSVYNKIEVWYPYEITEKNIKTFDINAITMAVKNVTADYPELKENAKRFRSYLSFSLKNKIETKMKNILKSCKKYAIVYRDVFIGGNLFVEHSNISRDKCKDIINKQRNSINETTRLHGSLLSIIPQSHIKKYILTYDEDYKDNIFPVVASLCEK